MKSGDTINSIKKTPTKWSVFFDRTLLDELIVYNSPTWCYAYRQT